MFTLLSHIGFMGDMLFFNSSKILSANCEIYSTYLSSPVDMRDLTPETYCTVLTLFLWPFNSKTVP